MNETEALVQILEEYKRANKIYGEEHFNTLHGGIAIIREEFEELWDEIKGVQDRNDLEKEAVQLGAMALKFLVNLDRMSTKG